MRHVLLYGAGLDSLATLLHMHKRGVAFDLMHLDYGQAAAAAERAAMVRVAEMYKLQSHCATDHSIRAMNARPSTMWGDGQDEENLNPQLNGRNTVAIFKAATEYDHIWLGLDQTPPDVEPFSDCTPDFLTAMSKVLAATYPDRLITLHAPNLQHPKIDCYETALRQEPMFFNLAMTCWRPRKREHYEEWGNCWIECTVCKHCQGKATAMSRLGFTYSPSKIPEIE